jgi:hypothetical protein
MEPIESFAPTFTFLLGLMVGYLYRLIGDYT